VQKGRRRFHKEQRHQDVNAPENAEKSNDVENQTADMSLVMQHAEFGRKLCNHGSRQVGRNREDRARRNERIQDAVIDDPNPAAGNRMKDEAAQIQDHRRREDHDALAYDNAALDAGEAPIDQRCNGCHLCVLEPVPLLKSGRTPEWGRSRLLDVSRVGFLLTVTNAAARGTTKRENRP
jgi:hypothetical protein